MLNYRGIRRSRARSMTAGEAGNGNGSGSASGSSEDAGASSSEEDGEARAARAASAAGLDPYRFGPSVGAVPPRPRARVAGPLAAGCDCCLLRGGSGSGGSGSGSWGSERGSRGGTPRAAADAGDGEHFGMLSRIS